MGHKSINGISLPLLGFGCMRLPVTGSDIDTKHFIEMVDCSIKGGFNYFDTAVFYHGGGSQTAIGEAISKRYKRDDYILTDKMPPWQVNQPEDFDRIFKEQLEACAVDYFDFYLLHALSQENNKTCIQHGLYEKLKELKKTGKARHIGFSFHDSAQTLDDILTAHPEMEVVQLQINYLDWKDMDAQGCYEVAKKHGKPIVVMEPVRGGLLANLPESAAAILKEARPEMSVASWAIRYAASLENTVCVLSGMSNMDQLCDNMSVITDFEPLAPWEHSAIERALKALRSYKAIECTDCKYCSDCPQGIDIPRMFAVYNQFKRDSDMNRAASQYKGFVGNGPCIECGHCTSHCPQQIDIPSNIKMLNQFFSGS